MYNWQVGLKSAYNFIEEYFIMYHQYSPSFGKQSESQGSEQLTVPEINPRRQVSMMYGVEFNSKVPLFQRTHSTIQPCGANLLSEAEIYNKVHSFLNSLIERSSDILTLIANFRDLDDEMALSISISKKSISQRSSNSQSSIFTSEEKIDAMRDLSNKKMEVHLNVPKLKMIRNSMMKSNRISIADTMKINQLHEINKLSPIKSMHRTFSSQSQNSCLNQPEPAIRVLAPSLNAPHSLNDHLEPVIESDKDYDAETLVKINIVSPNIQKEEPSTLQIQQPKEKKKISIMIGEIQNEQFDSEIFSDDGEYLSLTSLNLPSLPFNLEILHQILDSPCPFLINLSLCLLCKYLQRSGISLSEGNASWLFILSTIVAYKIYYDEPIEGLIDFYSSIMGMEAKEVILLERWFLQQVGYQVVVSSSQYQAVLSQLVAR